MRGLILLSLCAVAMAADISGLATNLSGPVSVLKHMMLYAGFILGVALTIGAIMLYRQHRMNPKLVPLPTPILLLLLGLGTIYMSYVWLNTDKERDGSSARQESMSRSHIESVRERELQRAREDAARAREGQSTRPSQPATAPSAPGNDYWSY